MASVKGHPFWLHLLEICKKKHESCIGKFLTIMNWTGPGAMTRAVKSWRSKYDDVIALPGELSGCDICHTGVQKKGAYVIPLQGQSWAGPQEMLVNKAFCFYKSGWFWLFVTAIVIMITILIVLYRDYKVAKTAYENMCCDDGICSSPPK